MCQHDINVQILGAFCFYLSNCMLKVCIGAVTRIFLVSSFMLEIVLWKLDCSVLFRVVGWKFNDPAGE